MTKKTPKHYNLAPLGRTILNRVVKELHAVSSEAFGYTVEQWAKKAGVCNTTVYNLLSGHTRFPRFETIRKMAHALKMEIVILEKDVAYKTLPWESRKKGKKAA